MQGDTVPKKKKSEHKIIKWIRTDDKAGFKPNFKIICHLCGSEMFLRNSELMFFHQNARGIIKGEPMLKNMYKCEPCAQVYWFYISYPYMDSDYWNELYKRRDEYFMWIPDPKTWSSEARVQQRLKDLGYLGGDIEYQEKTEIEEK